MDLLDHYDSSSSNDDDKLPKVFAEDCTNGTTETDHDNDHQKETSLIHI